MILSGMYLPIHDDGKYGNAGKDVNPDRYYDDVK
jgi:hypothetical protein